VDANLVTDAVKTADDLVQDSITSEMLVAQLSSFFGGLVLLLVCVGLYGSMSYGVEARTREIGVRVAMGAGRKDVIWMVTREASIMLAIGAAIGIPAGIAATMLFKSMLFGVGGADPLSIAAAIATLFAISFVAAIVPARRAMRVDPMVALRYE
jgi:ABC-type antimicrobial peptide transport system permease subunit